MARGRRARKEPLFIALMKMPWWAGVLGAAIVLVLEQLWVAFLLPKTGHLAPVVAQVRYFFFLLAAIFALGTVASLVRRAFNGKMLDSQTGPESIDELNWREFERLAEEVLRRQGYTATATESGADGGVDIVLSKNGERYLVQCKHWKTRQVGVGPVRELWGVVSAKGAAGGIFITSGSFTADAEAFADGVNLKLINGLELARLVRQVRAQTAKEKTSERVAPTIFAVPECPSCGGKMIKRTAKRGANTGKEFWGCDDYPTCRGTRAA